MTDGIDARVRAALEWIVRLPLLGEPELAQLLGVDEVEARHLRQELERRGWVESITPRVAGLNERPLAFVRDEAVTALADLLDMSRQELAEQAPVRRADVLHRIPRVEIVAGVHRLLADLAVSLRTRDESELVDGCTLPVAIPLMERWWPPAVHGYGCVRTRRRWAEFFVVWDRAGAPDIHRRQRVRTWCRQPGVLDSPAWPAPTLLVVCAGERERRVWEAALLSCIEQAGRAAFRALLTTASEAIESGPDAAIWTEPGVAQRARLTPALAWGGEPPAWPFSLPEGLALANVARTTPSLREQARSVAAAGDAAPARERMTALTLATDRRDKQLIEWIARNPLLSTRQLATLLCDPEPSITRRLTALAHCQAVRTVTAPGAAEDLWETTRPARLLLAIANDVSVGQYERHGGARAPRDPAKHRTLVHALGVNRTLERLAADARRVGWNLAVWRNEAESTHHFLVDGRRRFVRPDGSGVLARHGLLPFLLEYDRGTLDADDYVKKFRGYSSYAEGVAWREAFDREPVLLFVCADDRAELRVADAARREGHGLPLLMTSEWRFDPGSGHPAGLLGPIWRGVEEGGARIPLLGMQSEAVGDVASAHSEVGR